MKNYTGITFKYLKVQKKRTILTLLGIILSVALITSIGTMIVSMQDQMLRDAIRSTGDYHAIYKDIPADQVKIVQNHTGVKFSSVIRREGFGVLSPIINDKKDAYMPPYKYLSINSYSKSTFGLLNVKLKTGRLPQNSHEIAVDSLALKNIPGNPKLGDTVKFDIGTRYAEGRELDSISFAKDEEFIKVSQGEYTIVGLLEPKGIVNSGIITNGITLLDETLDTKSKYDIYVKMDSNSGIKEKLGTIAKDLGLQLIDGRYQQLDFNEGVLRLQAQSANSALNSSLILILVFLIVLIIFSTAAVIYNAFHISVLERTSQFGILRCTGASPGQIRKVVWKEAAFLCIIGIPVGFGCGILAMNIVMYIIGTIGFGSLGFLGDLRIIISVPVLLISTTLGAATVFLAATGPARQAGRVSPLEAVRNTGSYKKENFSKVRKKNLLGRFMNIEGQIAFKNLRRNRKRFKITVFSMVISIILFIVFGSFASSVFKIGAVESDMGVDYTLQVNDQKSFTQSEIDEIKAIQGVEDVYKHIMHHATVFVPKDKINRKFSEVYPSAVSNVKDNKIHLQNCNIIAPGPDGLNELKKYLKAGSIDEKALNSDDGVLLLQTSKFYTKDKSAVLDVTDFKPGDTITMSTGDQSNGELNIKSVKVMGIVEKSISAIKSDYAENGGIHLITTEQVYKKIIGNNDFSYLGIKMLEGTDRKPINDYLLKLSEESRYYYGDISKRNSEIQKSATAVSIFVYGFVGVITLIGCLNIINTLSTNLILRKRELSMMRAVGMTRSAINKMVGFEGVLYGITASIYGTIIGTILSYILSNIMRIAREYEWSIPWGHIAISIIGVLFVTIVSSLIPLRRISRQNIIENIRMEE